MWVLFILAAKEMIEVGLVWCTFLYSLKFLIFNKKRKKKGGGSTCFIFSSHVLSLESQMVSPETRLLALLITFFFQSIFMHMR